MSKPSTAQTLGTILGVTYMLGLPLAFIAIEVLAANQLDGWLASFLYGVAAWNVYVYLARLWELGRLLHGKASPADSEAST